MSATSSTQIKIGGLVSYGAIAINIITGLIYTPWMIRSIGREDFGLYTLALSVISLFALDLGLGQAITRFVAKYLAEGKRQAINDCLGLVYKLYIYLDLALLVILTAIFFLIPEIYKELTPAEVEKFKVVYAISAIYSVLSFPFIPLNGILSAYEKFIQLKLCDLFHKLFIVATMSICLVLGYGVYALILVNVISGLLTIALKFYVIKKESGIHINFSYKDKKLFREIISFSGWVTVISLSQRITLNIIPSILGALSGSAAIALFGIALTIEGYTYTFASAINGMFLPRVSRIVTNEGGDVLPLMIKVGRVQMLVLGLVTLGFFLFGRPFITLWVGDSFAQSYVCAMLLILPAIFHYTQEIADSTIIIKGEVKLKGIAFLLMAVTNILISFPLCKYYGAVGASLSVCVAYFVRTIVIDIIYHKKLQIDICKFFKQSLLQMILPFALIASLGAGIIYLSPIIGWEDMIAKMILFCIIYIIVVSIFVLNKNEKDLFMSPATKIIKTFKHHKLNQLND